MTYILSNHNQYCFIDNKNAVHKTQDINMATKFTEYDKANKILNKATKKLKGFKIVDFDSSKEVCNKIKRRKFSASERILVYNKNRGRCAICGDFVPYDQFTLDHIIPLAKGGTNELTNLQCTCTTCNAIKQDILPDDLIKKLVKIIQYQMRVSFDDSIWKKINYLKRLERRKKIKRVINDLIKK